MSRRPLIIANWKLNGGIDLICMSVASFIGKKFAVQVAICPPNIYMRDMFNFLQQSDVKIGGQNVSKFESGAYTGETSAQMLKTAGCVLCLIGHSERRAMFGENDQSCQVKVANTLAAGMLPVLCVGENQQQRQAKLTTDVITQQIREGLHTIDIGDHHLCIAYEPVWVIGTGLAATPEAAQEVHLLIRQQLTALYGPETAANINILYGGSVNKHNAEALLRQDDIDGLLVGGASLDPGHFLAICELASALQ